jgi:hypothetical protein
LALLPESGTLKFSDSTGRIFTLMMALSKSRLQKRKPPAAEQCRFSIIFDNGCCLQNRIQD